MQIFQSLNVNDIISIFMVLFAIIDITGSLPIIIDVKNKVGKINELQVTMVSFLLMISFLFIGESLLHMFGVDISSFAIAGAFVIFLIALEMVLGIEIFHNQNVSGASIVPLAFPLIAGAGSMTTLLSLKAQYDTVNIVIALIFNMVVIYIVLKLAGFFEKILGPTGIYILRKMFGIILIAISVKLFVSNTGIELVHH